MKRLLMNTRTTNWNEANQRYLMACVDQVRELLRVRLAPDESGSPAKNASPARDGRKQGGRREKKASGAAAGIEWSLPEAPAIDALCAVFKLSEFERRILLLSAAMELDSSFGELCAAAQGDARRAVPTFSLALAALPEAHWSAIAPQSPLRHWRLIEVGDGQTLTTSPLRIDERALHYLTGVNCLDARLQGLARPVMLSAELPPSHQTVVYDLIESLADKTDAAQIAIQLCGDDEAGRRAVAAALCALLGVQLLELDCHDLPSSPVECETLARLCEREAALNRSFWLIDCRDAGAPDELRPLARFVESLQSAVIVTGREPLRLSRRNPLRFEVNKPGAAERQAIWRQTLGQSAESLNGQVEAVSTQFSLSSSAIRAAGLEFARRTTANPGADAGATLWDVCRRQCSVKLADLAHRIEPAGAWDDLVLPETQLLTLRQMAAHVRRRAQVYEQWGFASKSARGLGIGALFSGPTGTGKTMAAEVLANELRLDLYRIDLSSLVSKYIGETEKNLRRVFDAAEDGGAILLFDEADALFGKRSEVRDSHDRYANIEVSYLLQRIEAYRGLAILTSNLKQAIDSAFMRRLRFIVHFPFPDAQQRAEIWRRIFPADTPTEDLDWEKLAQLSLAGGGIRNLAMNAAFLAADEKQPVRMNHLLAAAHSEYAKMEKSLSQAEIGDWT
jgi:ATPase family associated with various cellular activities (AAA)/Winged helix domain, variant